MAGQARLTPTPKQFWMTYVTSSVEIKQGEGLMIEGGSTQCIATCSSTFNASTRKFAVTCIEK